MATQPLTHHEILGLVEPFTRQGRHVDLAASNRLERSLMFKAIDHAGDPVVAAPLRETLQLENPSADYFRLTRILALANGLEARLEIAGADPARLLERIEAIPRSCQFRAGPGFTIALSHRIEGASAATSAAVPAVAPEARLILTRAVIAVAGLTLALVVPTVRGLSAEFRVTAPPEDPIALPEDLLAVLGWDWSVLRRTTDAWTGSINLRGREPMRSRRAEERLVTTAEHLARTLSEPPLRFHERLGAARWRVALRRCLPLIACAVLIVGAISLSRLKLAEDSALRMLMFNAPPLLMVLVFSLREMPRFELPPLPRRPRATAWRVPGVEAGTASRG